MNDISRWNNEYQEQDIEPLKQIKKYPWSKVILQVAGSIDAKKVLEAGAGSGKFSFLLASEGYDAIAMDLNDSVFKALKKKNKKRGNPIKVVKENILDMKFEDNSFDLVFNEGVCEHMLGSDREKAIKEMLRVSKNKILIFVPDIESQVYKRKYPEIPEGEYPFTKNELLDLAKKCGVKNPKVRVLPNTPQIVLAGDKDGRSD